MTTTARVGFSTISAEQHAAHLALINREWQYTGQAAMQRGFDNLIRSQQGCGQSLMASGVYCANLESETKVIKQWNTFEIHGDLSAEARSPSFFRVFNGSIYETITGPEAVALAKLINSQIGQKIASIRYH